MTKSTQKITGFYLDDIFYPYIAGGDGTGGDPEDPPKDPPADPPKDPPAGFSQAQVDQMMAAQRKSYEKATAASTKKFEDLSGEFNSMKDLIAKMTPDPEDDPKLTEGTPAEQAEKRITYERKKSKDALDAAEKRTLAITEKLEATEKRRMTAERDRFLDEALVKSGCRDLKAAKRIFREQMVYDEEAGTWSFLSDEGGSMSVEEGVDADLPDYLRSSKASGGSGGKTPQARLETSITKKKEELKAQTVKAQKTGDDNELAKILQLKRELRELTRAAA